MNLEKVLGRLNKKNWRQSFFSSKFVRPFVYLYAASYYTILQRKNYFPEIYPQCLMDYYERNLNIPENADEYLEKEIRKFMSKMTGHIRSVETSGFHDEIEARDAWKKYIKFYNYLRTKGLEKIDFDSLCELEGINLKELYEIEDLYKKKKISLDERLKVGSFFIDYFEVLPISGFREFLRSKFIYFDRKKEIDDNESFYEKLINESIEDTVYIVENKKRLENLINQRYKRRRKNKPNLDNYTAGCFDKNCAYLLLYGRDFLKEYILALEKDIIEGDADKFDRRLRYFHRTYSTGIATLFSGLTPPKQIMEYLDNFSTESITILYNIGITPDKFSSEQQEYYLDILSKITDPTGEARDFKTVFKGSKLIGTGASSIVLLRENSAWKFSLNISEEARLLKKLKNPEYVVRVKGDGEVQGGIAVELEYLSGGTIEQKLIEKGPIDSNDILRYSYDVFQGLEELYEAGIYHKDINPSNVMIEEKKNRAMIIDLGIATDNLNEILLIYEDEKSPNRRYGGTDLMSLGQVMYKMRTGENLFTEYSMPSAEAAKKGLIQKRRNEYIRDENIRKNYKKKVKDNIKNEELENIIITCLDAGIEFGENLTSEEIKEHAYSQVREMFKKYL